MILKDFQEAIYTEKRLILKILSFLMVSLRTPLYSIVWLLLLNNVMTYDAITISQIKHLSVACSILGMALISLFSYLMANFLNLQVPNNLLPWSEAHERPFLLQSLFKVLIVIAFKFKDNTPLLYILATLAFAIMLYKIYFSFVTS